MYAEWLSSSAPASDSSTKSTPPSGDSRVPCLAQHTIAAPIQDVPMMVEQEDRKQAATDNMTSSSSSFHDIWLRSNSCASAVHEYSNFRFMYSTDKNQENDNIWLAGGAKKAGQQKWSPKRQRLEAPESLSLWSTSSVAPASSKSSSDNASSSQDIMMIDDNAKDKEDATMSAWLNVKKSVPKDDKVSNAVMDTNEDSKASADLVSSWLNVRTTTTTKASTTDQISAVTQKEKDILGWIESVQKVDATAPNDYDAWLIKTGDSHEKEGDARKDSLDAIRSGFKTLQVGTGFWVRNFLCRLSF